MEQKLNPALLIYPGTGRFLNEKTMEYEFKVAGKTVARVAMEAVETENKEVMKKILRHISATVWENIINEFM